GLRRRAVDLVREHDVAEDRAAPDPELPGRELVYRCPDDVARHEIGRELDPLERAADELRDRAREQRLRGPWHPLDEDMPAEHEGDVREPDRLVLAHDHLVEIRLETGCGVLDGHDAS